MSRSQPDDALNLSRRGVLRALGALGGLAAVGGFTAACREEQEAGGPQAATGFALLGDRYHNSAHHRTALGKTLVREGGNTLDFSDEGSLLNPDHLARYRLLIILRDGMVWPNGHGNPGSNAGWWSQGQHEIISEPPLPELDTSSEEWMTPEMGLAVRDFVAGGGGALFYHNVTHIALLNDDFRDVLGAVYQGHPPIRPFRVRITNRDHPITQGVNDFLVTDEQHYMEYQKDPEHLFMESVNEDGLSYGEYGTTAAAGWAYDYGEGRVCYMSPGHLISAMWNPEYEKLQRNAVRWVLKEL